MTETVAYGYSSESTRRELSNEYQHDRVSMVSENLCILVLWTKVASVLVGLRMVMGWLIKNNGSIVVVNPLMLKEDKSSLAILTGKIFVGKISDGEILIKTLPKTIHHIFCKISLNTIIIVKSINIRARISVWNS